MWRDKNPTAVWNVTIKGDQSFGPVLLNSGSEAKRIFNHYHLHPNKGIWFFLIIWNPWSKEGGRDLCALQGFEQGKARKKKQGLCVSTARGLVRRGKSWTHGEKESMGGVWLLSEMPSKRRWHSQKHSKVQRHRDKSKWKLET